MQSAAKIQLKGAIYAEESSDEDIRAVDQEERSQEAQAGKNTEVINPSKSKYDKFVEEVKQRDSLARPKLETLQVDAQCELIESGVEFHVYEDYSTKLCLQDLQFDAGKIQDRVIKLQLLERADTKKWVIWMATGLVTSTQLKTKTFPFFSKPDAIASFEKKFEQYTENRWIEREFF